MNITYEDSFCQKCNISEEKNLRKKLQEELRVKHNLPKDWTGTFFNDNGEDVIEKAIKEFKNIFKQKCIIIGKIILCRKHFTELLEGFD